MALRKICIIQGVSKKGNYLIYISYWMFWCTRSLYIFTRSLYFDSPYTKTFNKLFIVQLLLKKESYKETLKCRKPNLYTWRIEALKQNLIKINSTNRFKNCPHIKFEFYSKHASLLNRFPTIQITKYTNNQLSEYRCIFVLVLRVMWTLSKKVV